jgi:hypothetical protein
MTICDCSRMDYDQNSSDHNPLKNSYDDMRMDYDQNSSDRNPFENSYGMDYDQNCYDLSFVAPVMSLAPYDNLS